MSIEYDPKTKTYTARARVIINDISVHKRSPKCKTKREAKEAEAELKAKGKTIIDIIAPKIKLPYLQLRDEYFKSKKIETKESSQFTIEHEFRKHIDSYFSGFDLRDITLDMLRCWQEELWTSGNGRGGKLSYASCKKIRSFFNTFLNFAEFYYDVPNLLRKIKIPKRIEQQREIIFLEPDEFHNFANCINDYPIKVMFVLDYYTGARIGEILALEEVDVTNFIVLNKTYSNKTTDKSPYKITPIKNYQTRKNDLPQPIIELIAAYKQWRIDNGMAGKFLFGGKNPIPYKTVLNKFNKYKSTAKITKPVTIHGFRHAYVSCLRKLGFSAKVIAELIGDTEEQVVKTYSHLFSDDKILAAKKLESLINVPKMYPATEESTTSSI